MSFLDRIFNIILSFVSLIDRSVAFPKELEFFFFLFTLGFSPYYALNKEREVLI
jgi:hypothetical protein